MAGLWDAFCTTVQETVEDLQERLPKDLTDHLRRDIPKRLQKVLETGLPDIEIKDEPAARLLGALGAVAPPPAGPLISARGWDEPSTSSSRAPEPEEQNGDGVGEEVSCQSECEDSVNGETMLQHPAEVESHVPPAPDFKDGENGLWGSFCTAVKETVGDLQERLPKDLTDHLREDIPERLQKNLAKGFQSIQIKDERALQLLGALGAVTPQPAGPLISENDDSAAVHANADTSSDGQKPPRQSTICPPSDRRMVCWSDMFFAYATIPTYVAHRNCKIGSWFISSVYDVFRREACKMHLQDMMRLVERDVMARPAHDGCRQTASTNTWAWTKTLYFNPGHFR